MRLTVSWMSKILWEDGKSLRSSVLCYAQLPMSFVENQLTPTRLALTTMILWDDSWFWHCSILFQMPRTIHVPRTNFNASPCLAFTTRNAFRIRWSAIRKRTAPTARTSHCIAMSTSAHECRTMDVIIDVLIPRKDFDASVMKDINSWRTEKLVR